MNEPVKTAMANARFMGSCIAEQNAHRAVIETRLGAADKMYAALTTVYGYLAGEDESYTVQRVEREVCAALTAAEDSEGR